MSIILGADRIVDFCKVLGMGGAVGKQVDHFKAGISPGLSELHACPDSRVVLLMVGTTGVEHQEDDILGIG